MNYFWSGPVNPKWGPGPVNTNWGPGPVNTDSGPGLGTGSGGQGQDWGPSKRLEARKYKDPQQTSTTYIT